MSCDNPQEQAWALLQAARRVIDARIAASHSPAGLNRSPLAGTSTSDDENHSWGFYYKALSHSVATLAGQDTDADLTLTPRGEWLYSEQLAQATRDMLDLYLPVLGTVLQPRVVIGHLGQSIDARIATSNGDAFFVTGEENRRHLHRLRSLCHAVVVGAGTVTTDDPQLTTRAVSGVSPVRVIIDPQARVPDSLKVMFDGEAPTWLLHADTLSLDTLPKSDTYRRLVVRCVNGRLQPRDILNVLAANGLRRIFVEGGGVTVSRFFNARCLNRLQIATAPLLVGEGVPALQIPGALSMQQALRPQYRLYRMGQDVMWDFKINDDLYDQKPTDAPEPSVDDPGEVALQRLW